MSTRSVLARPEGDSWGGRYCHSDGYPSYQGAALLHCYRNIFDGDAERMVKFFTEDHLSFSSLPALDGHTEVSCHCHGPQASAIKGGAGDWWITPTSDSCGTEWAYVLSGTGFFVFRNAFDGFSNLFAQAIDWRPVGFVRWDESRRLWNEDGVDTSEDWTDLECGPDFEWCGHYAWAHFPDAKGTKVGTAQWLGREPLSFSCVQEVIIRGRRYRVGGGHIAGPGLGHGPRYEAKTHRWVGYLNDVVTEQNLEAPIARVAKNGDERSPWPGVKWVFPEIPSRP